MRILIIGSGGRENALLWKLSQSPHVEKVYWTGSTRGHRVAANTACVPIAATAYGELVNFAREHRMAFTVVGPDQALADGVVDLFEQAGQKIYGPTAQAARLESSKSFGKKIMQEAGIPSAEWREFTDPQEAWQYLENAPGEQHVVKKDGLALGKGVVVCETRRAAQAAVQRFMVEEKCPQLIIEQYLTGRELSFFALCDGRDFVTLGCATDYKRIADGNLGPNTGGMGAYAPVEGVDDELVANIEQGVVQKLLHAMDARGDSL